MTRKSTTHGKVRPRRRLRRLIVFSTLGVLLGVLSILFFSYIYNPFGEQIGSPLVLIPDSADFVLDFPESIRKVRGAPFAQALKDHMYFPENWDRDPTLAGPAGVWDTVWRKLDEANLFKPLDLWGDISGAHVWICGYLPVPDQGTRGTALHRRQDRPATDIRFMLVVQPEDWRAIAGVNILLNETLCDWFLRDSIESQGLRIEHKRDLVMMELPAEKPGDPRQQLWITRIADTVLISTDERQLARIFNFVQQKGVPRSPAARYQDLRDRSGGYEARLLFRRERMGRYVEVEERLLELWGLDTLELARCLLPRFGGEDMIAELHVGHRAHDAGTVFAWKPGPAKNDDLQSLLRPFTAAALRDGHEDLKDLLPEPVFATVRLKARLGEICGFLLQHLFTAEDRKLFRAELKDVEGLGGYDRFLRKLTDTTRSQLTVAFFKQGRDVLEDAAEPGYALIAPIRDETGLKHLLSVIDRHVKKRQGESLIKQLYREEHDVIRPNGTEAHVSLYKPILPHGVVDDPRVTKPGIVIAGDYLVITNWFPFLRDIRKVLEGSMKPMGGGGFDRAMSNAPERMLVAAVIDGERVEPYLQQSLRGWAFAQTNPTQDDMQEWRREFSAQATKAGIPNGTRRFGDFVDNAFRRRYRDLTEVQRPVKFREFETYMKRLGFDPPRKPNERPPKPVPELLRGAGLFLESRGGRVRMSKQFDLLPQKK